MSLPGLFWRHKFISVLVSLMYSAWGWFFSQNNRSDRFWANRGTNGIPLLWWTVVQSQLFNQDKKREQTHRTIQHAKGIATYRNIGELFSSWAFVLAVLLLKIFSFFFKTYSINLFYCTYYLITPILLDFNMVLFGALLHQKLFNKTKQSDLQFLYVHMETFF